MFLLPVCLTYDHLFMKINNSSVCCMKCRVSFRNNVDSLSDKKLVNDKGFCLVSVLYLFRSLCLNLNQLTGNKQIFTALQIKIKNWSTWATVWPQTAVAFTSGVMKQSQLISARSAQLYLLVLELPLLPHQPIRVSLWWTLAGGVWWWCPLQSVFLLLFLQPHSLALWGPAEVLLSQKMVQKVDVPEGEA